MFYIFFLYNVKSTEKIINNLKEKNQSPNLYSFCILLESFPLDPEWFGKLFQKKNILEFMRFKGNTSVDFTKKLWYIQTSKIVKFNPEENGNRFISYYTPFLHLCVNPFPALPPPLLQVFHQPYTFLPTSIPQPLPLCTSYSHKLIIII